MVNKTDEEMAGLVDTLDLPIEATSTYEKWQKALRKELGDRASDIAVERTWAGVKTLYKKFPEAGVDYSRVAHWWGYEGQYRSTSLAITGQRPGTFLSFAKVKELLGK